MAEKAFEIGAIIKLDGEQEFKSAVTQVNKSISAMKSELGLIKEQYAGQANSLEALSKKHDVYSNVLEQQKTKVDRVKEGLENSRKAYSDLEKNVDSAQKAYQKASDKMEEMRKKSDTSSDSLEKQEKDVDKLAEALEKGNTNLEKQSMRISDWETKLNRADTEVIKANRALEQNAGYLKEAENSTDKCATSIDGFGKKIKKNEVEVENWGESIKAHLKSEIIIAGVRSLISVLQSGGNAIKDLATSAASYADDILTASTVTRMSTDSLQAYNYAAELVDVSLETLTKSMSKNVKSMYNAQKGTADYVNAYEKLGVSVTDADGNLRNSEDVYWDIIDALGNMSNETERDAVAMQLMGKSAQELNPLIEQGSSGIKALSEEAKSMGAVMSEDALSALGDTDDSLQRLYQSVDIFKRKVGAEMAPAVTDAANELTKVFSEVDDEVAELASGALNEAIKLFTWILENHKPITAGLKGIVAGLVMYKAVSAITNVVTALQSLRKTTQAAEVAQNALNIAQAVNPYALIAAGVAALGVALVSLASDTSDVTKEYEKEAEARRQANDSIREAIDTANQGTINIETEWGGVETLATKLMDLNAVEDKSTQQKGIMKSMVDQLSQSIPELAAAYDEETGAINMTDEEMKKLIQTKKEYAMVVGAQESLSDLGRQMWEAEQNVKRAAEAAEEAKAAYDAAEGAYYGSYLFEDAITVVETEKAYKAANAELEQYQQTQDDVNKKYEETVDYIEKNGAALETNTKQLEENAQVAEASVAAQVKALDSLYKKYEEMKSSIQQSMEQKINLFAVFEGGDDSSLDDIQKNINSQLEGLTNWKDNMAILAGEVGDTIGPELYDKLVELGPEAANAVQKMVDALGDESGKEQLKQISSDLAGSLDISEEASESIARTQTIFKTALGEMGSSEADFSGLKKSISSAVDSTAEGWAGISDETKTALDQAVETARQCGAEIPAGLADKIKSGETSATDAIAQLNASIDGQFQFLSEMANEAGIEIPNDIREGIEAGGPEAQKALSKLATLFSEKESSFSEEGEKAGTAYTQAETDAIIGNAPQVSEATAAVADGASGVIAKYSTSYSNNGRNLIIAMAQGMSGARDSVATAVRNAASAGQAAGSGYYNSYFGMGANLMDGAVSGMMANSYRLAEIARQAVANALAEAKKEANTNSPSRKWRDELGKMLAEGTALGIEDGEKSVVNRTTHMARASITAAKEELDINSPSGVFKKFGTFISEGLGIGIVSKKGYAVKAAAGMSNEVYKNAVSWMKDYKKINSVSLNEEKKFWKQVAKTTTKGSKEYKLALAEAAKIDNFQKTIQKKLKNSFDVSWYKKSGKKQVKKTADQFYSDLSKSANKWIQSQKAAGKISLEQEKYFWEQVKKKVGKGTKTYKDAAKKIKSIQQEINKEKAANKEVIAEKKDYGVSGAGLEAYKTYYKVSAKAEVQYWDQVRKAKGLSRAQQLEADKNYYAALESYNDQQEELNKDYLEKVKDTNEELKEEIKGLTEAYEEAVSDRKKTIYDSFGLFESFYSESASGEVLVNNMKSQVEGYAIWVQELEKLKEKGISDDLYERLQAEGPGSAATVLALNQYAEEQEKLGNNVIDELNSLNEQKLAIAESQAVKENEAFRKQTEAEIKELQNKAQAEINAYKITYDEGMKELSKTIETPLKTLASKATTLGEDATLKLIAGIKSGATKKDTTANLKSVSSTVESGLSSLPKAGKTIGKNTLQGILDGLNNKKKIKKSAKEFIEYLRKEMAKAADIHSPSRLFKKEIGAHIPSGVGEGIKEATPKATHAGADMIESLLDESRDKMKAQQNTLASYASNLNVGRGVAALNNLISTAEPQNTTVNVDNSSLLGAFSQMLAMMEEYFPQMANQQLVTDTGALIGETASGMSQSFALAQRRIRR